MSEKRDIIDDLICSALATDDPIEIHIMKHLFKFKYQNKRLKTHIEKTGAWANLKNIDDWKPYDFYHYFCSKYQEKYRSEYRVEGNIVRTYQRIESFMDGNKLSKLEYKNFIDKLFDNYFNNINLPIAANICSPSLFKFVMHKRVVPTKTSDYFTLEQQLFRENEKFEKFIRDRDSEYTAKNNQ